jgi:ParB-like nuclease domain
MAQHDPTPIEWHTEKRQVKDLMEWPKNPRTLTEAQARHLEVSLLKFGYVEPIAVNLDNTIIGGHMRRRVILAQALIAPGGVVDVRVPSRQLTTDECEELSIRLNKNTGDFDFDILANQFDMTKLLSWGFEQWEFGVAEEEPAPAVGGEGGSPPEVKCPKCGHCFTP